MAVIKRHFGTLKDGREAFLYTIGNRNGMEIAVSNYGAVLVSVILPDKNGKPTDVVLGYDDLAGYEQDKNMFGAMVGPNANRTEGARFVLNGREYQIPVNESGNNLHSSLDNGFHKQLWSEEAELENGVVFSYARRDGEDGFPGNTAYTVQYELTDENEIRLTTSAVSDADTIFNPTNHSYFNLSGAGTGVVDPISLWIHADAYMPVRDDAIPFCGATPVAGTAFDFRQHRKIGEGLRIGDRQLEMMKGYDHNYVLNDWTGELRKVAEARDPRSGIAMTVYTDLPGVQFFTANGTEAACSKGGIPVQKHEGFCLETQYAPNSMNMEGVPRPVLHRNVKGSTVTVYQFRLES